MSTTGKEGAKLNGRQAAEQGQRDSSRESAQRRSGKPVSQVETVTIRFAGDSGDGMQLVGTRFGDASALAGNEIATLPDYPSEVRAPAGTVAGVSGYQVQFSSRDIFTPGDGLDSLVAMNPAALKANLPDVRRGGILIVNEDAFSEPNIAKAGYKTNPLQDGSLAGYQVYRLPITRLNEQAVAGLGLTSKEAGRCKNMFALGLVCWLYDRPLDSPLAFIKSKFAAKPRVVEANVRSLRAGYDFGDAAEIFTARYHVPRAALAPGVYRCVTGNEAAALGMVAAAKLAGVPLFYASYPITPASEILHELSALKNHDVLTFQAEDEIAAMGAAIGAAFGGRLAATGTSGPGLCLKSEAIGLAVMTELPVVIVDVQRGGPSTGLPTKTEQSDLLQAFYGRSGESPVVVLAAASPSDCFAIVIEAFRIAVRYMLPVIVMSDGYLAQGAEPWRIPDLAGLPRIKIDHPTDPATFQPYKRDPDLARPWAIPGTPGLQHCIGGLEKQDVVGTISYDPANHDRMVRLRAEKVAGVVMSDESYRWTGPEGGKLLVVSWGSTWGAITRAVNELASRGVSVGYCHLRCLNPLPAGLGERLKRFDRVLVPEVNLGQLRLLLRAACLVDAQGLNKVPGKPFTTAEIVSGIEDALKGDVK